MSLEHCDLTGAKRGSDAIWQRETARDFMWNREVLTTNDGHTNSWAIGTGRVRSVAHYLGYEDAPYYFVQLYEKDWNAGGATTSRLEPYGTYWSLPRLLVVVDVDATVKRSTP